MNYDIIPSALAEKIEFADKFASGLKKNRENLRVSEKDIKDLLASYKAMKSKVEAAETAEAAYHEAVRTRREAVNEYVDNLRYVVRVIKLDPKVSDEVLAELGIESPSSKKSTFSRKENEVPVLNVKSDNGRVTVEIKMESPNARRRFKPEWARGCAIYRKKRGEAAFSLVTVAYQSPFIDEVTDSLDEYTYVAHYFKNTTSDKYKNSQPVSVAVRGGAFVCEKKLAA